MGSMNASKEQLFGSSTQQREVASECPGVPRTFDHDCSCLGHKLHLLYQKWYLQVGHWLYRYRYSKKIIGYLNPFSPRPANKKCPLSYFTV